MTRDTYTAASLDDLRSTHYATKADAVLDAAGSGRTVTRWEHRRTPIDSGFVVLDAQATVGFLDLRRSGVEYRWVDLDPADLTAADLRAASDTYRAVSAADDVVAEVAL